MNSPYLTSLGPEVKQKLTLHEMETLTTEFHKLQKSGRVEGDTVAALGSALAQRLGNQETFNRVFSSYRKPSLSFPEMVTLYMSCNIEKKQERVTQKGTGDTIHTFSEEEKAGYVDYINSTLAGEECLANILPVNPFSSDIFSVISNGVLLCKLINRGFPNAINQMKVKLRPANDYQKNENHDLCIQGAKDIGCSVINIGGKDLLAGTPHLVLGLVWQIIKKSLLALVAANLQAESSVPIDIPPEQMLLKWFNYHLANAGHPRVITNWSSDLKDSELYAVLLSQLEPKHIGPVEVKTALDEEDLLSRAEIVLSYADRISCRKFVTPREIVNGNPRLNLAFVATLFNKYPHMGPTGEEKRLAELETQLQDANHELRGLTDERDNLAALLKRKTEDYERKSAEADETALRLSEALASRDHLAGLNTQLEAMLAERTKEHAAALAEIESLSADKERLANQLEEERALHERTRHQLDEMERQLAEEKARAEEERRRMMEQLEAERKRSEALAEALRKAEEAAAAEREAARRREEELLALLAQERAAKEALAAQLAAALKENEELQAKLRDERQLRANLEEELKETEEELEELRAETDDEKTLLLQRIKDLEEELEQLKGLMETSLDKATREKAEALLAANKAKELALLEAEQARIAHLRKVQGLLSKVQREGNLYIQEKVAVLGTSKWRQRYFVLQEHFLSYYKDKKGFENRKPLGIIDCEQCRVYEFEEPKRQFCFQLDSGKLQYHLSADKLDEMKNWMKDIKESKRKAIGMNVVSGVDAAPISPRGVGSPRKE